MGSPLEQPDVQRRSQEHLTPDDIERLSASALLQTGRLRRRCGQAGHTNPAPGIVLNGAIATH
jgi:hypothetical protein